LKAELTRVLADRNFGGGGLEKELKAFRLSVAQERSQTSAVEREVREALQAAGWGEAPAKAVAQREDEIARLRS
jgi:hypothetical protein